MRLPFFGCVVAVLAAGSVAAGLPFGTTPDWVSSDISMVSTGAALADLDRDGWLDLVVANGNDIHRQPLVVYYNRGNGTLPLTPDWSSSSEEYHGHLAVGDVNQDGWPDVAVCVFLGPGALRSTTATSRSATSTRTAGPTWRSVSSSGRGRSATKDGRRSI